MEELSKFDLLRKPFEPCQIGKLPKPTKFETDSVKADYKKGARCAVCGGWHHPNVIHLDYVGHAALTARLLDVDPLWAWEPLSLNAQGLPTFDKEGGLWIKLTILGVTRLGYGDAQGKTGANAIKEAIGDALRNAGMRFGLALDLWHKGDLYDMSDSKEEVEPEAKHPINENKDGMSEEEIRVIGAEEYLDSLLSLSSVEFLKKWTEWGKENTNKFTAASKKRIANFATQIGSAIKEREIKENK